MTYFKLFAISFILLALYPVKIYAESGDPSVTQVFRMTHPAYSTSNLWQGEGFGGEFSGSGPWNSDGTKILISEWTGVENPSYPGVTGRGLVWGNIDDLKSISTAVAVSKGDSTITGVGQVGKLPTGYDYRNDYAGTLAQYQAATHELPSYIGDAPVWSIFPGEDNILIAIRIDTEQVIKYNVDNGDEEVIVSYACTNGCSGTGDGFYYPGIIGWDINDKLIVSFTTVHTWTFNGWRVDVQAKTRNFLSDPRPERCTSAGHKFPISKTIHESWSLDRKYWINYSGLGGVRYNDYAGPKGCGDFDTYGYVDVVHPNNSSSYHYTHCQWVWTDDSYVCGSISDGYHNKAKYPPNAPYVDTYLLGQIFFDRDNETFRDNFLLEMDAAGLWYASYPGTSYNYHGIITPTVRKDFQQIMFMSTNGAYSLEDYDARGATPYSSRGIFLAELSSIPQETCTSFNYTAWGECQPDDTKTRTVTSSSPSGCTGGNPLLTQSCTYDPGPQTCTSFNYTVWGECQPDDTETRTVTSSSPTGCTSGNPLLTQSCTYDPGPQTCTSFNYTAWSECQPDDTKTRTVASSSPSGCTGGNPLLTQSCTYDPGPQTCTSFNYTAWDECQPDNTKTRTVTSSSPSGCTGGNPMLIQSCTYDPGVPLHSLLKATSSPVIDGNLGEYALAHSLSFSPATGGNTVTVRTLWDSEAIYFGINVIDSQLNASVTTRDESLWNEDSIEWFIDTYYDGGGSNDPDSAYMRTDDYHGIVNVLNTQYDSQGTISGAPSGSWNGSWQSAVQINGTNNNNADTDSDYTMEVKIPWTSIGYSDAPSEDTLVGLSFVVNDKDASGIISLMLPDITNAFENASNWKEVLLSGTAVSVDTVAPSPPFGLTVE